MSIWQYDMIIFAITVWYSPSFGSKFLNAIMKTSTITMAIAMARATATFKDCAQQRTQPWPERIQ